MPMRDCLVSALSTGVLLTALMSPAGAQQSAGGGAPAPADRAAIRGVLSRYQGALNASDAERAASLYAADGVLMPPYRPSVVGKAAVRDAYEVGSRSLRFHVSFTVDEVVQVSPEWAFARTTSAGTLTDAATGATSLESNQELFVFEKGRDGVWAIARYSFSSTNPPPR